MDISQLIADHGACFYLIAFIWTFLEGETFVLFAGFALICLYIAYERLSNRL